MPLEPGAQLEPLRQALLTAELPRTVLTWLRTSESARLLHDIAASGRALTHADLGTLAVSTGRGGAQSTDYLRSLLVAYGILPVRDEYLAGIERHLARMVARHPQHAPLLRPYVRWSVLPRARRRAARIPSTRGRTTWSSTRVNAAVDFLQHLAALGLSLDKATQHHIDQWLAGGPTTRYETRDFIVWAARRGHCTPLTVPHRSKAEPETMDEDTHWDLLQQCLHDEELPLDVRVAGSLLLLFGQHLSGIVTLTTAHLGNTDGHTTLRLDDTPIRLPNPLGHLLNRLAEEQPQHGWAANTSSNWLFPGIRPGTHRSTGPLSRALAAHGIPIRPSRATALLQLAQDMPPAVLAPLLGMHVITAQQWRRRTGTDWTTYLQARRRALDAGRTPPVQR
ncbi:hypothetical protein [Streptomyces sp. KR55]|uniref:hypothetical protein n=1 Tax=Streptomyces sp. KR55 TaxID=3457425 RepID=UPI003FD1229D